MKKTPIAASLLSLVVLTGCSTVKDPYIPQTVGAARISNPENGIRLSLNASGEVARLGEPVKLKVTVHNEGAEAVWIPNDPYLLMVWVYPNGRNDNMLLDPPRAMHFTEKNARLLAPGEQMAKEISLDTYYFPGAGITEFRAILKVAGSTNPALKPFWAGRAVSNPFGVMMVKDTDPYAAHVDRTQVVARHDSSSGS